MMILGFDIGGTKCAVIVAEWDGKEVKLLAKEKCLTVFSIAPETMIDNLINIADRLIGDGTIEAVGISCGGPLDSKAGVIMGPPNLPGWNNVEIVKQIKKHYNVPVHLQNDANACAVAEWKFGAGRGSDNMIFMTFGTGLGAGLILDGKLYSGTNDNAGEAGHIRLERTGPVGFGKAGSFEGFCSGSGIAQLGYILALEQIQQGNYPLYFKPGMTAEKVTAKMVADAADAGDITAMKVYELCGEYLGRGLSILIDILNPQKIVIGSIFARRRDLLWEATKRVIENEALSPAADVCEVVPAELGENIGDFGAIATALL
ncbi:MAG: ROK family protein [Tyzzerella sp.]|nr:ROK family protein [Tyzzerella sp.]